MCSNDSLGSISESKGSGELYEMSRNSIRILALSFEKGEFDWNPNSFKSEYKMK